MRIEGAGEADDQRADDERDETLAHDIDARRARCDRLIPRRAQREAGA